MLIFLLYYYCYVINKICIIYYNLKLILICILYIIYCIIKFYCIIFKYYNLDIFKSKFCFGTEYILNEYCRNYVRFYSTDVDNLRVIFRNVR